MRRNLMRRRRVSDANISTKGICRISDLDDFVNLDTDYEVHRQAREADAALAVEAAFDAQNEALHLSIVNPSDEGFSIISKGAGMDGWFRP